MRLSRAQLNAYNDAMNAFQGGAESYFRRLMDAYREERPDAGVAECREFCIVAMGEALGIYAPAAQELAAQMFDYICEAEAIDARAELPAELYDRDMLVEAAHYNAGKLVDGDWDGFVDSESRLANFYVRRSAYEAMRQSCKDGHVRWARVPTGRESCGYCFMLSSRGFDYVSEDTAKAGSHVGCDCIVVPGKQGRTEIEGYDPDALYERWKECQEASGSSDYADVIKEVETRDWDWLWMGVSSKHNNETDTRIDDDMKRVLYDYIHGGYGGMTSWTQFKHGGDGPWESRYSDYSDRHLKNVRDSIPDDRKADGERLYSMVMQQDEPPRTLVRTEDDYGGGTANAPRSTRLDEKPPEVGEVLSFGVKSASKDVDFAEKIAADAIPGMGSMSFSHLDAGGRVVAYRVHEATRYLDISEYSDFVAQDEALIAGDYRVTGTHVEQVVVGTRAKEKTVELPPITPREKLAQAGGELEYFTSKKSGKEMVRSSANPSMSFAVADLDVPKLRQTQTVEEIEELTVEVLYIDLEEI